MALAELARHLGKTHVNQLIRTNEIWGALNDFERKHAPEELFIEGDASLLSEGLRVAVVGSRKASDAGLKRARLLVEALVRHGITVVSGLADAAGVRGAARPLCR